MSQSHVGQRIRILRPVRIDANEQFEENPAAENLLQLLARQEWSYFDGQKYNQEELNILQEVMFQFYELCSRAPFYAMKSLLDFQIEIIENENPA